MKKNILVTGGAGYIGSHIVELLLKKNYRVFIIDNLSTGFTQLINKKAKFYNLNINKTKKIRKIIQMNNITSIIHLAAHLSVSEGEKKPKKYYLNNVTGTLNLLKSCINTKVKVFLFSSTCAVYKDGILKVNENTKLLPKSVYGKTKLIGENLIKTYSKKHNFNYGIFRFFNVAGASSSKKIGLIQNGDQLFKNLSIASLKKNPKVYIYGNKYNTYDGTCIRDYIHVSDIADIHLKSLSKIFKINRSVTLNCGYGFGISVLNVINAFQKITKNKIKIIIKNKRKGDMEKIISISNNLKKFINWKPKLNTLSNMVKSSVAWERKLKIK